MNFLEAIKTIIESKETLWVCPKGSTILWAFALGEHNQIDEVPSDRGGERAMLPSIKELLGEWEAIPPKVLIKRSDERLKRI